MPSKLSYLLPLLFCSLLFSSLRAQDIQRTLNEMRETQNVLVQTQIQERVTKIVNTPDFVRAANVSLNALVLSNSLTDYLNDVSDLNNPNNSDLGFSLTQRVEELMEQHVFAGAGKPKKGFPRVMEITRGVLQHPLVSTFTSAIPVVNSLSSVMDLVTNLAVNDPSIPVEGVNAFRENIIRYVQHYQGLSDATRKLQGTVMAVQERTDEMRIMLKSFTVQRVTNLFPDQVDQAAAEPSLRNVLLHIYEKDRVTDTIGKILIRYQQDKQPGDISVLTDPRFVYPEYVVNEARFILDELHAITQEYLVAFTEYQHDLEAVLQQSKDIGDADKIDRKILVLQSKLKKVEDAFLNAVHVEEVEYRFKALAKTRISDNR
ncbi:MAG TPA: hypothetical protein PLO67_12515 [Saprospiraceae bacterium]|nr:hypothetical protein [Saprospiraceae bacterium]HPI07434.1 hypothetical protein [Saprospiraceae bacterium]